MKASSSWFRASFGNTLLMSLLASPCVNAQYREQTSTEFSKALSVSFGAEHDSNPAQIPDSPDKDTRLFTQLSTQVGHQATYNQMSLDYQADYSDYVEDTLDEEYTFVGSGQLTLGSASSPLKWRFANTEQETLLRATLPDTPGNSSTRSTFTTGPTVSLRFGKVDTVQLQSEVSYTKVENSPIDTKSEQSSISWLHQQSRHTTWSLSTSYNKITPDEAVFSQYKQYRTGLGWQYSGNQFQASADFGLNRVETQAAPEDTFSEIAFSLQKSWASQSLQARFERSISNSGENQDFEELLNLNDVGAQTFELTRRESASFDYTFDKLFEHQNLVYSLTITRAVSLESPSIDKIRYNTLRLERSINPRTSMTFNIAYTNYFTRSNSGDESEREEGIASLAARYNYSASINFNCQAGYVSNNTDLGSFNSNVASCSVAVDLL